MGSTFSCIKTPAHTISKSPRNINVNNNNPNNTIQGSMASASRIQMQLTTNDILSAADLKTFRESTSKNNKTENDYDYDSEHHPNNNNNNNIDLIDDGYYDLSERKLFEHRRPNSSNLNLSNNLLSTMEWKKGDMLGRGAYGTVYMALNQHNGELMAVKEVQIVPNNGIVKNQNGVRGADQYVQSLESEIAVLSKLSHRNIVRYIGTQRDDKNLYIFLEYISGGSIASLLKTFGKFDENVVKIYTKMILDGLHYLHSHRIIHRDIKGGNILIDNNGIPKLADFGAAKKLADISDTAANPKSLCGTPYWMAPEVIKQTGHGRHADVWSLGCTVIEMLTGKPPWHQFKTQVSALFHIASTTKPPQLPPNLSPTAKSFILSCLQRNPRDRSNSYKLLQHPFVRDVVIDSSSHNNSQSQINCNIFQQQRHPMAMPMADNVQSSYMEIKTIESMDRGDDHSSDDVLPKHSHIVNEDSYSVMPLLQPPNSENPNISLSATHTPTTESHIMDIHKSQSHPRLNGNGDIKQSMHASYSSSRQQQRIKKLRSKPSEADRKVISQYLIHQYNTKRDHLTGDFKDSYVRGYTPDKNERRLYERKRDEMTIQKRRYSKNCNQSDIETVFRSIKVQPSTKHKHSFSGGNPRSLKMDSPINDPSNVILMSADHY